MPARGILPSNSHLSDKERTAVRARAVEKAERDKKGNRRHRKHMKEGNEKENKRKGIKTREEKLRRK